MTGCCAVSTSPDFEQRLLPSLGFRCIVLIEQINELAHARRQWTRGSELFMCLLNFGIIVLSQTLRFQGEDVGDVVLAIHAERQSRHRRCAQVAVGPPDRDRKALQLVSAH